MSFPINICSHNKDDVLSWRMVLYHVMISHSLVHFTAFQLLAHCDFKQAILLMCSGQADKELTS